MSRVVPVDGKRADWPRLAANEINALQPRADALEGRATALETKTNYAALVNYADDTAAAAGGVPVGGLYRTASAVKVRVA